MCARPPYVIAVHQDDSHLTSDPLWSSPHGNQLSQAFQANFTASPLVRLNSTSASEPRPRARSFICSSTSSSASSFSPPTSQCLDIARVLGVLNDRQ